MMDIQSSTSSCHQVGTLDLPPAHEPVLSAAAHVSQTAGILPTLNESHFGTQPEMEAEDLMTLDDESIAATNSQQLMEEVGSGGVGWGWGSTLTHNYGGLRRGGEPSNSATS